MGIVTMEKKIEVGDVVMLKSGGPEMTVISKKGSVCFCKWFLNSNYNFFIKDCNFSEESLKKISQD